MRQALVLWFWLVAVVQLWSQSALEMADPDPAMRVDDLVADWFILTDSLRTDSLPGDTLRPSRFYTTNFRMVNLLSAGIDGSGSHKSWRYRALVSGGGFKFASVTQTDYLTTGIEVSPIKGRLQLLFGDFQFDFGLGLGLSTRYQFDSWTIDPVKRMYRSGGLRVNTSSDPSRRLQGGACSFQQGSMKYSGFFSNEAAGFAAESIQPNLLAGMLVFSSPTGTAVLPGFSLYAKHNHRGMIFFGEIVRQSSGSFGGEGGVTFFGHEKHQWLFRMQFLSEEFDPYLNKLAYTNPKEEAQTNLMLSYLYRMGSDLSLLAELQKGGAFKVALTQQDRHWGYWFIRTSVKDQEIKASFRMRLLQGDSGYLQVESGAGLSGSFKDGINTSRFAAIDYKWACFHEVLQIILGFTMNSGEEGAPLLYRYEPDLLYQMSIPVMSKSGVSGFIRMRYDLHPDWRIEAKVSRTVKYGGVVGTPSRLQFQLIYRPGWEARSS